MIIYGNDDNGPEAVGLFTWFASTIFRAFHVNVDYLHRHILELLKFQPWPTIHHEYLVAVTPRKRHSCINQILDS